MERSTFRKMTNIAASNVLKNSSPTLVLNARNQLVVILRSYTTVTITGMKTVSAAITAAVPWPMIPSLSRTTGSPAPSACLGLTAQHVTAVREPSNQGRRVLSMAALTGMNAASPAVAA